SERPAGEVVKRRWRGRVGRDDDRDRGLAPPFVLPGYHGDVRDGRMGGQDVLDLGAVDVLPAGDDHVFLAVDDVQEALVVGPYQVAGVEPAPGEDLLGGGWVVPVTGVETASEPDRTLRRFRCSFHPRSRGPRH